MTLRHWILLSVLLAGIMFPDTIRAQENDSTVPSLGSEPVSIVVKPDGLNADKVTLGRLLFHDPRLSGDDSVSCATCHDLKAGGTLNMKSSFPGVSGKTIPLNIPTVLGSSHNFVQFWDGRAATLEEQAGGPITNPDEMAADWDEIVKKLASDKAYSQEFLRVYRAPPKQEHIKDALAEFERSLVPTNAPFDQYLQGNKTAISEEAKEGYALFKNLGCASCHQGSNVGGNMFQKFGIMGDYFTDRGQVIKEDYGRFNVTGNEDDRYVFKVPSLRNVELTAPYFHDGSAATLEDAINIMGKYQLGRDLSAAEKAKLAAFLKTLTGTLEP